MLLPREDGSIRTAVEVLIHDYLDFPRCDARLGIPATGRNHGGIVDEVEIEEDLRAVQRIGVATVTGDSYQVVVACARDVRLEEGVVEVPRGGLRLLCDELVHVQRVEVETGAEHDAQHSQCQEKANHRGRC